MNGNGILAVVWIDILPIVDTNFALKLKGLTTDNNLYMNKE